MTDSVEVSIDDMAKVPIDTGMRESESSFASLRSVTYCSRSASVRLARHSPPSAVVVASQRIRLNSKTDGWPCQLEHG